MTKFRCMTNKLKIPIFIIVHILIAFIMGCSVKGEIETELDMPAEPIDDMNSVSMYDGEMSKEIPYVYTTKKELSLTFNGLGSKEMVGQLLDQLDQNGIKATFFLPGIRVAEEPDIAREIASRGHEVENNTLHRLDLTTLPYNDIYQEIHLANKIIEEKTGVTPKYVRTKSGEYNDDVRLAAAHAGLDAVIYYSANPQDWDMKSAEAIANYVAKYITRGGIITLNTDINPAIIQAIPLIAKAVDDVGYELVPLVKLVEGGSERLPLASIPGYDAVKINPNYEAAQYEIIEHLNTDQKKIALTFDDWGSDNKITEILNILNEQQVKATFFVRVDGVEANPNLARAIVEEGHDIANHTYTHPIITTITPEELQKEVVKAHQVLTEAIQEQPAMLFRPPTGTVDDISAKAVAATGLKKIMQYDVTTMDWDVSNDADDILSSVLEQTKSGSIILLHLQDEIHTAEALPRILSELKANGYRFMKLTDVIEIE